MLLAERAAGNREILRIGIDKTAIHRTVAGDNAIGRHILFLLAEVRAAMLHEHVELDEGTLVKELFETLARRILALGMLLLNACRTAAQADVRLLRIHLVNLFLNGCHFNPPMISIVTASLFCTFFAKIASSY